jgi:ABC-type uncharacterized transport system ATPase subunit
MYAVELENISKTFAGGVQANKNITLRIEQGEVHGLLGENGAGKSTLMNILYGMISHDTGRILIKGEEVDLRNPTDAIIRGVGMVHQHFKLIPTLTVAENIVLGMEPIKGGLEKKKGGVWGAIRKILPIDFRWANKKIMEIGEENGLEVDPNAKIRDLSVGEQQRVEIIKTLYREADILILDEPTSVLTPQEVDELFVTLEKFKQAGKTIILITHKLREPMMLCDRISVLRDGELIGTVNRTETSPEELARMMVGREVVFRVSKTPAQPGETVLTVTDLYARDTRNLPAVNGISVKVRSGEIYGIAGVEGNGQTELVQVIAGILQPEEDLSRYSWLHRFRRRYVTKLLGLINLAAIIVVIALSSLAGEPEVFFSLLDDYMWVLIPSFIIDIINRLILRKNYHGSIRIFSHDITGLSVRKVRMSGISHIPEDRHARGLILSFTISENMALGKHQRPPYARGPRNSLLDMGTMRADAQRLVETYSIKVSDVNAIASTLSGGNQQKVVVARELSINPALVIASQPTRGLDVGATEFIHNTLIRMRDAGSAVLLVSAELSEVMTVADRIGVIFDGRIVAEKEPSTTTAEELGLLMAGHSPEDITPQEGANF